MSDSDLLPDHDPDLRLAQRLDAGLEPDGSDALHDALAPLAARPAGADAAAAERIWAGIAPALRAPAPRRAPAADRIASAPARTPLVRRLRTWSAPVAIVALTTAIALGVFWRLGPSVKTVAEASDSVVTWTAPDGSEVTLRPHSRLSRLDRSGRAYSLTGEAYFAVAHDEGAPFTVATTHGDVTVLGTRFTVATWAGDTRVFVEEGRVGVSSGTDRRVLAAGDAARSTRGGLVQDDPEATAETALDWTDSTLAFRSTPAARVAAELEHHFRVRIDLPERLRGEALTGSLPLADRDEALGQFGRVLGGRLRADANGVLRFEE